MFGKYLTGIIGLIIVFVGLIPLISGLVNGLSYEFWIGLGMIIFGNYFRYLSKQATTVENTIKVDKPKKK
mgnify:CR=1 FL=1|tara:strand:- start:462 stop:671 length:210 start_codon:yes stop_codon:yes gene_type:complete